MDFPEALRSAMGDLTQEELESLSGVDQSSISRYLQGSARPSLANLERLESALPPLRSLRTKVPA